MQTFTSVKGCYMATIHWKDAYYSVPILEEYPQYLKFQWKGKLFQYTCLPNGLSSAPRIFTMLTKSIHSTLRKKGYLNSAYIDDSFLIGDTVEECRLNVVDTVSAGLKAWFVIT